MDDPISHVRLYRDDGAMSESFLDGKVDCQCTRCGRLHRKLATNPPPAAVGELSSADYERLSRAFLRIANLHINTSDYRINEWLKRKIAEAAQ